MYNWEIDVAVLIIFFTRDKQLRQTFEAVKKARPRKLLLWQDGPRNENDISGITACRDIVKDIDWECEVHTHYNEKNYGCDPSTFYSHKWAFSIVDKCIVLEDDFVANQSFFKFCKELLDKYEEDERINHICGMNMLGDYADCQYDYFFGFTGSNAWASWKRVVDGWGESYSFLHNESAIKNLRSIYGKKFERWYSKAKQREKTGVPYWESILCFDSIMNSRLAVIASKNMVNNIGMTADSTHSNTQTKFLTKTEQSLFNLKTYELEFPLKHPPYVIADLEYTKRLNKFFGVGHPLIRAGRRIYHCWKYFIYGELFKKIGVKFKQLFKGN